MLEVIKVYIRKEEADLLKNENNYRLYMPFFLSRYSIYTEEVFIPKKEILFSTSINIFLENQDYIFLSISKKEILDLDPNVIRYVPISTIRNDRYKYKIKLNDTIVNLSKHVFFYESDLLDLNLSFFSLPRPDMFISTNYLIHSFINNDNSLKY